MRYYLIPIIVAVLGMFVFFVSGCVTLETILQGLEKAALEGGKAAIVEVKSGNLDVEGIGAAAGVGALPAILAAVGELISGFSSDS